MIWLAKIKTGLALAGAVVLAIAGAAIVAWLQGRRYAMEHAKAKIAEAKTRAAVANQVATQHETRVTSDEKVQGVDTTDAAVDRNLGGWLRDDDETPKSG